MAASQSPPLSKLKAHGFAGLVLIMVAVGPPHASDVSNEEIERLRERIQDITSRLNQVRTEHDFALEELRSHEVETGALVRQLRDVQEQLNHNAVELEELNAQIEAERSTLSEHRALLVHHMRSSDSIGRQDAIKLVLNLEDLGALSRSLNYHVFLQTKRLDRIAAVTESLDELREIEARTGQNRAALKLLQTEQSAAANSLRVHRQGRIKLIASLRTELATGAEELTRLKRNEEKLAQLLAGIRQELSVVGVPTDEIESFVSLKGALPWPTSGRMLNRFGTPRPEGNLMWQGVLISATEGVPVKAISHGRVAFADWLRGFGLLLILDHGNGYMSLYGRNQSLFKEVGEWVSSGEQIAVVGEADASGPAALYFEIRHNGAPQNPTIWCNGNSLVSG